MFRTIALAAVLMVVALPAFAQQPEMWRRLAAGVEPGSVIKVRLTDGRSFHAVLVEARGEDMMIEPKTRIPVPVQPVRYADVTAMERVQKNGGVTAGKAAAIGIASGIGAFFGVLLFTLAAFSD